jgi:hypothetical protein
LRVLGLNHVGGQAEPTCGALVPASRTQTRVQPGWQPTRGLSGQG